MWLWYCYYHHYHQDWSIHHLWSTHVNGAPAWPSGSAVPSGLESWAPSWLGQGQRYRELAVKTCLLLTSAPYLIPQGSPIPTFSSSPA